MCLGSHIAVAVVQASSCSSDSTPSLGTFICCGCGPKKTNGRKKGREGGRKEGKEGRKRKKEREKGW